MVELRLTLVQPEREDRTYARLGYRSSGLLSTAEAMVLRVGETVLGIPVYSHDQKLRRFIRERLERDTLHVR